MIEYDSWRNIFAIADMKFIILGIIQVEEKLTAIFDTLTKIIAISQSPEHNRMEYLSLGVKIIEIIEKCKSRDSLQMVERLINDNSESFNALHVEDKHWSTGEIFYMDEVIKNLLAKQLAIYSPKSRALLNGI